jgi:L-alanine-DL-glutamate epimerase-like enolase superfamily enzyme
VNAACVASRRPADVAREVERLRKAGCTRFVVRPLDGGGMLDLERLGAARYAAGLQAGVELEGAVAAVR